MRSGFAEMVPEAEKKKTVNEFENFSPEKVGLCYAAV